MTNIISPIDLKHSSALEHAPYGMRRRGRDRGIVHATQSVTVSRKHVFMLVYTYSKRSQKHEAVQRSKHAPRGPLRTDTCTACARVRHAPLICAETVRILVSISAVSSEKTRRQTVRAEVLRPPPLSIANVRICISKFVNFRLELSSFNETCPPRR